MEPNRPWISLILFCFTAVLTAALAFAAVVAGASFALVRHQTSSALASRAGEQAPENPGPTGSKGENRTTFSGLVTDSFCGARHRRYRNLAPTECAAACIRDGAAFVLVNGDHSYKLTGSREALTKLLGMRANVTGTLQGNTILVDSAAPLF
ncbi:MAG: hypothetical protein J2P13_00390 [Acidobacteria bacterium]|nr:hypothetical protein [Acidobacteriota bacterium]